MELGPGPPCQLRFVFPWTQAPWWPGSAWAPLGLPCSCRLLFTDPSLWIWLFLSPVSKWLLPEVMCGLFFFFFFLFYSHSWYMKDGKSLSLRFLKKLLCLLTSNLAIMQSIGILVPSSLWWSFPLFQRKFLIPCSYCDNDTLG